MEHTKSKAISRKVLIGKYSDRVPHLVRNATISNTLIEEDKISIYFQDDGSSNAIVYILERRNLDPNQTAKINQLEDDQQKTKLESSED